MFEIFQNLRVKSTAQGLQGHDRHNAISERALVWKTATVACYWWILHWLHVHTFTQQHLHMRVSIFYQEIARLWAAEQHRLIYGRPICSLFTQRIGMPQRPLSVLWPSFSKRGPLGWQFRTDIFVPTRSQVASLFLFGYLNRMLHFISIRYYCQFNKSKAKYTLYNSLQFWKYWKYLKNFNKASSPNYVICYDIL